MFQIGEKVKVIKQNRARPVIGEGQITARYPIETASGVVYGYELEDERGFTHHYTEAHLKESEV